MKLLVENVEDAQFLIEDAGNGEKNYFIEGIFIQAEQKNRNGRIYPMSIIERELARYQKDFIDRNRAYGALDHPDSPTVKLQEACHIIKSLRKEGNNFIGKAKILDTPHGKIAKVLMKEGCQIGVSTRGYGSLSEGSGAKVVGADFVFQTVDCVSDPSAHEAFVANIMENKEYMLIEGVITERTIDKIQKEIKSLTSAQINEGAVSDLFDKFLQSLKS